MPSPGSMSPLAVNAWRISALLRGSRGRTRCGRGSFARGRWRWRGQTLSTEADQGIRRDGRGSLGGDHRLADSQLSNGLLEGTDSLVQAAKRRARGYRSKDKMIPIIYLITGKLPLPEIHTI